MQFHHYSATEQTQYEVGCPGNQNYIVHQHIRPGLIILGVDVRGGFKIFVWIPSKQLT